MTDKTLADLLGLDLDDEQVQRALAHLTERQMLAQASTQERYRVKAREIFDDDNIDIDDHATVSVDALGGWVQAWLFIDKEHLEK